MLSKDLLPLIGHDDCGSQDVSNDERTFVGADYYRRSVPAQKPLPMLISLMILASIAPLSSCGTDGTRSEHSRQREAIYKFNEISRKAKEAVELGKPWKGANGKVPQPILKR